jgi:hypothetical protein
VFFSADGKRVIRVSRTQFLKLDDPATAAVLKEATRFYGAPKVADLPNETLVYGNAFSLTRKGNAVDLTRNSCGTGLLIMGQACGDGSFGLSDCKGLGVRYVSYDLVDNVGLKKSLIEGTTALKEVEKGKLSTLKF